MSPHQHSAIGAAPAGGLGRFTASVFVPDTRPGGQTAGTHWPGGIAAGTTQSPATLAPDAPRLAHSPSVPWSWLLLPANTVTRTPAGAVV